MKEITISELQKRVKDKYVNVIRRYDHTNHRWLFEVIAVSSVRKENFETINEIKEVA